MGHLFGIARTDALTFLGDQTMNEYQVRMRYAGSVLLDIKAENETEAAEFYDTFRKRGLTGLVKATRGKKAATVDIVQQLAFEFDDLVDQTGVTHMIRPRAGTPMPIEIVDAFLEKMTQNPQQFADGLRKIGAKYGSVLLPKERLHMIRSRVSELEDLVKSLGV